MSNTDEQLNLFILFMKNAKPGAIKGLQEHNWVKVASNYNGGGWRKGDPNYASNLEKFFNEFK